MAKEPTKQFLKEAIDFLSPLIKQAGKMALDNWGRIEIEKYKDQRDIVTKADIEIENFLKNKILSKWPDHGFFGEEGRRVNQLSPFQWLIDPIDGTKFYAKQAPFFQVQIALVFNEEPILGLIYNPVSKQLFSASKGNGASLNNEVILPKSPVSMNKAIIDVDLGGMIDKEPKERAWLLAKLCRIMEKSYRVRMLGGSLSIYLVTGAINAYVTDSNSTKPQDLAAKLAIMQEAGYKTGWVKTPFKIEILLVSQEPVFSELKNILLK